MLAAVQMAEVEVGAWFVLAFITMFIGMAMDPDHDIHLRSWAMFWPVLLVFRIVRWRRRF